MNQRIADIDGAMPCMHPRSDYCTDCKPAYERDYDQEIKDAAAMLEE